MTQNELFQATDAFFARHNGKEEGYPGNSYMGECLSEVKIFMNELFGFNPPSSGVDAAYGYWTNFPSPLGDYFDKVPNTPTGVPQKGDIPIYKGTLSGSNGCGHICIATGVGDTNTYQSFGQNWGGKQAHYQTLNYTNIYGWLRPKTEENVPATVPQPAPAPVPSPAPAPVVPAPDIVTPPEPTPVVPETVIIPPVIPETPPIVEQPISEPKVSVEVPVVEQVPETPAEMIGEGSTWTLTPVIPKPNWFGNFIVWVIKKWKGIK